METKHEVGHEIMRQAVEQHKEAVDAFLKEACAKHGLKPGEEGVVLRQYTHVNGNPLAFLYELLMKNTVLEQFAIELEIKTEGENNGTGE